MPVTRSPSRPPSGSPAYSPTDLPAYRGGSSFSPLSLSPLAWARSSISTLYQDSAGTTPVTGAGQDVGLREDQSGNSADFTQATATARPTYETSPTRLEYDVDDALSCTLPAISGGQIVIISPAGTWIDDLDFAGGTFTVGPDTYTGGPAGLMALLGNEEIETIILPTPMTEAEQAKMVSYAQGLGSAGLITLGAETVTNTPITGSPAGSGTVLYPTGSTVTSGKTYLRSAVVSGYSGTASVGFSSNGFGAVLSTSANGTISEIRAATSTSMTNMFTLNTNTANFSEISIREIIMP